jgi:DNA repair protein RadC
VKILNHLLKELPENERPRERLEKYGPSSLSDSELIAIILRTGTKNISVLSLASCILCEYETINDLSEVTIEELCKIKGIQKTKAITLLASIELGKRITNYQNNKTFIKGTSDTYNYLKSKLSHLEQEHFVAIFLSPNNEIITDKIISIGTTTSTIANPKDVIKYALKYSAYAIIVAHNHPTGNVSPSKHDIDFTIDLEKACRIVDIILIDHVIIGKNNYFSFKHKSIFKE